MSPARLVPNSTVAPGQLGPPTLHAREGRRPDRPRCLSSQHLSSGEAAKLRGLCAWLDSSLSGCALRGALYALTARQYWDTDTKVEPGDTLDICLRYLRAAAMAIPHRSFSPPRTHSEARSSIHGCPGEWIEGSHRGIAGD